ncbi:MAG: hypothetical protein PHQ52_05885 [Candidatus Omnitrophica bacterium]|nr:hypothetical protein [Candidatus Omnitrophota bacterium]
MKKTNTKNIQEPPCKNKKLCDMCAKYVDKIPCCDAVPFRKQVYRNWTKLLSGKADCVDLFAIKKDLLQVDAFNFKATTWCMFPVLQKGDDLLIDDAGYDDMQIGDLPAYKGGDHLFTHRIVGKKEINGKRYLVTRPDTSKGEGENGELISEENILGKVREVKRNNIVCAQEQRKAVLKDNIVYKKAKLHDKWQMFCIKTLESIQQWAIYKVIAKNIGKKFLNKVTFVISMPITKSLAVYQHKNMEQVTPEEIKDLAFFHVVMLLKKRSIGVLTVLNRQEECPYSGLWMGGMFVRRPYRKTGLENVIVERTEKFLASNFTQTIKKSVSLFEMKTFI